MSISPISRRPKAATIATAASPPTGRPPAAPESPAAPIISSPSAAPAASRRRTSSPPSRSIPTPCRLPSISNIGGNCSRRLPPHAFHAELDAFRRLVEAHYRKPVILYLTEEFDAAYQVSARVPRPLWLRSLVFEPDYGARPWRSGRPQTSAACAASRAASTGTWRGLDSRSDHRPVRRSAPALMNAAPVLYSCQRPGKHAMMSARQDPRRQPDARSRALLTNVPTRVQRPTVLDAPENPEPADGSSKAVLRTRSSAGSIDLLGASIDRLPSTAARAHRPDASGDRSTRRRRAARLVSSRDLLPLEGCRQSL